MSFRHVNIYANDFLLHDKCLVIFDSLYMQVLVTLRYLSKGDFFSEVGDLHSISRPSVSRIIHNGMNKILISLSNKQDAVHAYCLYYKIQNKIHSFYSFFNNTIVLRSIVYFFLLIYNSVLGHQH